MMNLHLGEKLYVGNPRVWFGEGGAESAKPNWKVMLPKMFFVLTTCVGMACLGAIQSVQRLDRVEGNEAALPPGVVVVQHGRHYGKVTDSATSAFNGNADYVCLVPTDGSPAGTRVGFGLDFGDEHVAVLTSAQVLTRNLAATCQRTANSVICGSNDEDWFGNYTVISSMVPSPTAVNTWYDLEGTSNGFYRYLHIHWPDDNYVSYAEVAELRFFGYLVPSVSIRGVMTASATWGDLFGSSLPTELDSVFLRANGENLTLTIDQPACAKELTLLAESPTSVTVALAGGITFSLGEGDALAGRLVFAEGSKLRLNRPAGREVPSDREVLFTAAEGIVLPVGGDVADFIEIADGLAALSDDGTQVLMALPSRAPVVAEWVGNGQPGNILDAANWVCRAVDGTELPGELPTNTYTVAKVKGLAVFDVPTGSPIIWKRLVFDNFVCAEDCDLHGLDLSTIAADSTVDLNGHKMYITALDGSRLNPFTVTNAIQFARWSHLRFQVFDVIGPNSDAMQFSEMKIFSSSEEISHSNAIVEWDRVTAPASGSPIGRTESTPDLLFDDNLDTKWCDLRGKYTESDEVKAALWFTVTYPEPVEVAKYMMYTAGDSTKYLKRNPYSWKMQGSLDGENWTDISVEQGWTKMSWGNKKLSYVGHTQPQNIPGELHVNVPGGNVFVNEKLLMVGNVKLVKEGEGTYVAAYSQSEWSDNVYLGGTEVVAGKVMLPERLSSNDIGVSPRLAILGPRIPFSVTVDSGSLLDINGSPDWWTCLITLAGGTLASTGFDRVSGFDQLGNIVVTDTSLIRDETGLRFANRRMLDIGGKTLTLSLAPGKYAQFDERYVITNGNLRVTSDDGTGRFVVGGDAMAMTANLDLDCLIEISTPFAVNDLTCRQPLPTEVSTAVTKVFGTFKAVTDYFPSVELQDGASLDLSEKPEGWSLISANTTTNRTYAVSFAPNAKIGVQVGSRRLRNMEQLVAWEERPEQVDFKLVSTSLSGRLAVTQSGIFYTCGMVIVIR